MKQAEIVRRAAREHFRETAAERAVLARTLGEATEDLGQVLTGAAEALEVVEGSLPVLVERAGGTSDVRETASRILEAAWERLEAAGVNRDGVVGEDVDTRRHRVVDSQGRVGGPGGRLVARVVKHGLMFRDRRLREAWVVATPKEG